MRTLLAGSEMIQRFIRCPHCGLPHPVEQAVCPGTGQALRTKSSRPPRPPTQPPPARPPAPGALRESAAPPSRPAVAGHLLGRTIGGRYRVRGVLGEGGMGTVFEAEHIALGRSVAVKVLRATHATPAGSREAIRRFHQEARAAGAIGHPNICGVIDLGTLDDGSPYIVMERLIGETLADRIASEGGLPFEDVIDILTQVLSGLVAAHEQQIVHRDIKPENVFLTRRVGCRPLVKLLDFGVSKMTGLPVAGARQEDLILTRTGMVMGTPYYMAPEQARGERDLDARVDLYACGVILYEALTGRRPFTAANYNALLVQILSTAPRLASELRPALPPSFDAVIGKAMAQRREDRYAVAADFQRDLLALACGRTPSGGDAVRLPAVEPPSSATLAVVSITFGGESPGGLLAPDPTEVVSELAVAMTGAPGVPDSERLPEGTDGDGDPTQLMAPAKPVEVDRR
jgi:eukaryotic-like serine/threonine-protein kinase